MKRLITLLLVVCAFSTLRAQHSLQLNAAGAVPTILTGSTNGGTYTFPPNGGTVLTNDASSPGVSDAWLLGGNVVTTAKIFGTKSGSAFDVIMHANGVEKMRLVSGGGVTIAGTLGILEGGASPTKYTIFTGGDQTVDITYTLPTSQGAASTVLTNDGTGVLSWAAAGGGGGGSGTVTSVDASGSQGVTVGGVPFTTSGTISIGLGSITPSSVSTGGGLTLSGAASTLTLGAAVGTSGQVLTSAGAGATPTWTTPTTNWAIIGNASTTYGTNFVGTTDPAELMFKVNGEISGRIEHLTPFATSMGFQALNVNTGANNTASGYQSLKSNTTGTDNTASGYQSLVSNTSGSSNTAIGSGSLSANNTGSRNTATGFQALGTNTSAVNNSAFGYQALFSSTSGVGLNTAVGYQSLLSNTIGNKNTACGSSALTNNTTGSSNTAVGHGALNGVTTGSNNTGIGTGAFISATVSNATAIGAGASATASNSIQLGNNTVTLVKSFGALQVPSLKGAAANQYAEQHTVTAGEIFGTTVLIPNAIVAGGTSVVVATLVSGPGGYVKSVSALPGEVGITFNVAPTTATIVNYIVVNP